MTSLEIKIILNENDLKSIAESIPQLLSNPMVQKLLVKIQQETKPKKKTKRN